MRVLAAVFACLAVWPLRAEVGFEVAPIRAIVLHVHNEIVDRAFMAPLRARLARDLAPPIHELDTSFDLADSTGLLGRVDADALMAALLVSIPPPQAAGGVHVMLIARDMAGGSARFNFAWSYGGPDTSHRVIVVSLSRLSHAVADLTAARVARMIVKNVARVAGYSGSELCVFGFPRSLAELDALPENYCEPDHSALVAAGLARR